MADYVRTFRPVAAFLAVMLVCAQPDEGQTQDQKTYTVAVFAPDLNFGDAIGAASYADRVASAVGSRSGLPVRGVAFARAGDISARAKAGKVDFAVVGGAYAAVSGLGKTITHGRGKARLVFVGRGGGSIASLRGKRLILPQPARAYEKYVTAAVLAHQVPAREFFEISTTKNVQSALAAVKLGQADLTVALEPYARNAGLTTIHATKAGPMPVVMQVNDDLDPEIASRLASGFRGASVSGAGVVSGFGGSGEGTRSFRGYAGSRARLKRPKMAPSRNLRMKFLPKVTGPGGLSPGQPAEIVTLPALPEEESR